MLSTIKNFAFRFLRLSGAIALIYICMIFYLVLTERQIAFPRAITHKEANAAIQGKAQGISCTLDDGTVLGGWSYGNAAAPVLLYYPDTDEDAAQFLAETGSIDNLNLVTFNYRGSGNNKGTPSSETFESDAKQIAECATQVSNQIPKFISGRGIGAILATQNANFSTNLILIDPIFSIADKINSKYRLLYPKFLIRTNVAMPEKNKKQFVKNTVILKDNKQNEIYSESVAKKLSVSNILQADGSNLKDKVILAVQHLSNQ